MAYLPARLWRAINMPLKPWFNDIVPHYLTLSATFLGDYDQLAIFLSKCFSNLYFVAYASYR